MQRKILLGLTTTPHSDWRAKVREIDELELKEIALFPTFLEFKERQELYALLEKTGVQKIPHVHLRREDMGEEELDYFAEKYGTKVFNIHPSGPSSKLTSGKYGSMIYVENLSRIDGVFMEILDRSAGLCLDFSHWESAANNQPNYNRLKELAAKYKIGCCHISAVRRRVCFRGKCLFVHDRHYLKRMSELDYVKKYRQYLPEYISIELENPFTAQVKVKKYLENLLSI